eukprot:2806134-Rhodomonas_salina.4
MGGFISKKKKAEVIREVELLWVENVTLSTGALFTGLSRGPDAPTKFGQLVFTENRDEGDEDGRVQYTGGFFSGQMHGLGVLELIDDRTYFGEFNYDSVDGKGSILLGHMVEQRGDFQRGVPHGMCIELEESAVEEDSSGPAKLESFEGHWVNGEKDGIGFTGETTEPEMGKLHEVNRIMFQVHASGELESEEPYSNIVEEDEEEVPEEVLEIEVAIEEAAFAERKARRMRYAVEALLQRGKQMHEHKDAKTTAEEILKLWEHQKELVEADDEHANQRDLMFQQLEAYEKEQREADDAVAKLANDRAQADLDMQEAAKEVDEAEEAENVALQQRKHAQHLQDQVAKAMHEAKNLRVQAEVKRLNLAEAESKLKTKEEAVDAANEAQAAKQELVREAEVKLEEAKASEAEAESKRAACHQELEEAEKKLRRVKAQLHQSREQVQQRELANASNRGPPPDALVLAQEREQALSEASMEVEGRLQDLRAEEREKARAAKESHRALSEAEQHLMQQQLAVEGVRRSADFEAEELRATEELIEELKAACPVIMCAA